MKNNINILYFVKAFVVKVNKNGQVLIATAKRVKSVKYTEKADVKLTDKM